MTLSMILPVLLFLFWPATVAAHKDPKTPQEIEVQKALQAAAYHVRTLANFLNAYAHILF